MWPTEFKLMLNFRIALDREDTPFLVGFHGFFDKSNNISKDILYLLCSLTQWLQNKADFQYRTGQLRHIFPLYNTACLILVVPPLV